MSSPARRSCSPKPARLRGRRAAAAARGAGHRRQVPGRIARLRQAVTVHERNIEALQARKSAPRQRGRGRDVAAPTPRDDAHRRDLAPGRSPVVQRPRGDRAETRAHAFAPGGAGSALRVDIDRDTRVPLPRGARADGRCAPRPRPRVPDRRFDCSRPLCSCSTTRTRSSTRTRPRRTCSSSRERQLVGHTSRDVFDDCAGASRRRSARRWRAARRTPSRSSSSARPASPSCISPARCRRSTLRGGALLLEFRHIDQQLKIAREERLHEQHQANRELIRSLAHEIKNPLGGIRGRRAAARARARPPAAHRVHAGDHQRGRPAAVAGQPAADAAPAAAAIAGSTSTRCWSG